MVHSRQDATASISHSDTELLAAALADPGQFALLYDRYVDPIYRYCDRRLRDREQSEDATSQIFEKAFVNLARCASDAFRPWLYTIAHNVVVDIHRQRRPQATLANAELVPDSVSGPEELALRDESGRTVRALLESLSPEYRAVIELRLAGLSGTEAMEVLGISRELLATRTYRAMNKMRAQLQLTNEEGTRQ